MVEVGSEVDEVSEAVDFFEEAAEEVLDVFVTVAEVDLVDEDVLVDLELVDVEDGVD